jgi:hypothetical protein
MPDVSASTSQVQAILADPESQAILLQRANDPAFQAKLVIAGAAYQAYRTGAFSLTALWAVVQLLFANEPQIVAIVQQIIAAFGGTPLPIPSPTPTATPGGTIPVVSA